MKKSLLVAVFLLVVSLLSFGQVPSSEVDLFSGVDGVVLDAGAQETTEGGLGPVGGAIVGAGADLAVQLINNKGDITKTDWVSVGVSAGVGALSSGVSAGATLLSKTVSVSSNVAKSEAIIKGTGEVISTVGSAVSGGLKKDVTTTTTSSNGSTSSVTVSKPWWSW